jgi:hypothetical protein
VLQDILRPPANGASKEERLRFVRRCAILPFTWLIVVWAIVLALAPVQTWLLILLGVCTVLGVANLASLTWRIRRLRTS